MPEQPALADAEATVTPQPEPTQKVVDDNVEMHAEAVEDKEDDKDKDDPPQTDADTVVPSTEREEATDAMDSEMEKPAAEDEEAEEAPMEADAEHSADNKDNKAKGSGKGKTKGRAAKAKASEAKEKAKAKAKSRTSKSKEGEDDDSENADDEGLFAKKSKKDSKKDSKEKGEKKKEKKTKDKSEKTKDKDDKEKKEKKEKKSKKSKDDPEKQSSMLAFITNPLKKSKSGDSQVEDTAPSAGNGGEGGEDIEWWHQWDSVSCCFPTGSHVKQGFCSCQNGHADITRKGWQCMTSQWFWYLLILTTDSDSYWLLTHCVDTWYQQTMNEPWTIFFIWTAESSWRDHSLWCWTWSASVLAWYFSALRHHHSAAKMVGILRPFQSSSGQFRSSGYRLFVLCYFVELCWWFVVVVLCFVFNVYYKVIKYCF